MSRVRAVLRDNAAVLQMELQYIPLRHTDEVHFLAEYILIELFQSEYLGTRLFQILVVDAAADRTPAALFLP